MTILPIINKIPATWQELQTFTAQVLTGCGYETRVEYEVPNVRGNSVIDVFA